MMRDFERHFSRSATAPAGLDFSIFELSPTGPSWMAPAQRQLHDLRGSRCLGNRLHPPFLCTGAPMRQALNLPDAIAQVRADQVGISFWRSAEHRGRASP